MICGSVVRCTITIGNAKNIYRTAIWVFCHGYKVGFSLHCAGLLCSTWVVLKALVRRVIYLIKNRHGSQPTHTKCHLTHWHHVTFLWLLKPMPWLSGGSGLTIGKGEKPAEPRGRTEPIHPLCYIVCTCVSLLLVLVPTSHGSCSHCKGTWWWFNVLYCCIYDTCLNNVNNI